MRRLLVPLALAIAALLPAAAQASVGIGIADQKSEMFSDPRYTALGLRYARLNLRWDVLKDPAATAALDTWMAGAKTTGARPLSTFDRSPARKSYNPKPAELASVLKRLRLRYPGLKDVSTWNEANLSKKPELVATWYRALRRACPTCTILGADLVDHPNAVTWAKRFVKAFGRAPQVWGWHNYVDANKLSTKSTRALLRAVGGKVWFTETGGIVSRNNGSGVAFPTSIERAAQVTRFIFDRLATISPRIERVYLYHWDTGLSETGAATWDSGFVGPDGQARPALEVLQGIVARAAAAAA